MYYLLENLIYTPEIVIDSSKGNYEEIEGKYLIQLLDDESKKTKMLGTIIRKVSMITDLIEKDDLVETNKGLFLVTSIINEKNSNFSFNYEVIEIEKYHIKAIYKKNNDGYYCIWRK